MAFTVVQTTTFFGNGVQMGLSNHTHLQLQIEGMTFVIDMGEIFNSNWDQFVRNCKRHRQIRDLNNQGNLTYQQPFTVLVHSLCRLKVALVVVHHYIATGCLLIAANMRWGSVLLNFEQQYKT